ncbi:MAG: phosphatase PAP2 family protein [Mycobacteriales bacterium]
MWFIVTMMILAGVAAGLWLTERACAPHGAVGRRQKLLLAGYCAVALLAIAFLWRSRAVAKADGSVVKALARSRGQSLNSVMTVVTTIGDTVPSYLIVGVLGALIFMQGRHRVLVWVLPIAVFVELMIQFAFGHIFHDVTISAVYPHLSLGGAGTIPSGSISRLTVIFLIAARLWATYDPRGARRVLGLGASIIVIEAVSRLYLGRHLLADIAGGMLLGLVLANAFFAACSFAKIALPRFSLAGPTVPRENAMGGPPRATERANVLDGA